MQVALDGIVEDDQRVAKAPPHHERGRSVGQQGREVAVFAEALAVGTVELEQGLLMRFVGVSKLRLEPTPTLLLDRLAHLVACPTLVKLDFEDQRVRLPANARVTVWVKTLSLNLLPGKS